MISVSIHDAHQFFAKHQAEQDRLKQEKSPEAMEVRLRPYFPSSFGSEPLIFTVKTGGEIVGISECTRENGKLEMSYVSVDERHRRLGIASAIVKAIVDFAKENRFAVLNISYYTESGDKYLKHVLRRACTSIDLRESGKPAPARRPRP